MQNQLLPHECKDTKRWFLERTCTHKMWSNVFHVVLFIGIWLHPQWMLKLQSNCADIKFSIVWSVNKIDNLLYLFNAWIITSSSWLYERWFYLFELCNSSGDGCSSFFFFNFFACRLPVRWLTSGENFFISFVTDRLPIIPKVSLETKVLLALKIFTVFLFSSSMEHGQFSSYQNSHKITHLTVCLQCYERRTERKRSFGFCVLLPRSWVFESEIALCSIASFPHARRCFRFVWCKKKTELLFGWRSCIHLYWSKCVQMRLYNSSLFI